MQQSAGVLAGLSAELAGVVERVGPSVVRVDDGSRLTASGVVWSADGVIVTSSHGLERDEGVVVELGDGARHPVEVAGRDPDTDLAVLRARVSGLPALSAAPPEAVKVGQLALAIARPGEGGLQATIGIISARFDTESAGEPGYIVNTDAVLYPGFSGGLLANIQGEAVGIANRAFGRGSGVAIGMPVARQVVEALLAHGTVRRGYLGVSTQLVPLPANLRERLSLSQETALLVVQVESGSPAEQGGLLLGDTLLAIDGEPIGDVDDLRRQLRRLPVGQQATVK